MLFVLFLFPFKVFHHVRFKTNSQFDNQKKFGLIKIMSGRIKFGGNFQPLLRDTVAGLCENNIRRISNFKHI